MHLNEHREGFKKHLPLIQAYAEGKTIQVRTSTGGWIDADTPVFAWNRGYRIKPEPVVKTLYMTVYEGSEVRPKRRVSGL